MRKVIFSSLISLLLLLPSLVRADEGMWFLMFLKRLNERDMQKQGLQLTAEEIYSINNNSLKNAIVQFNGSCTASIISPEGLVITNHHCGYGSIADLSTAQHNYLRDGYWAKTKADELPPKRLFVRFFVRMDNVTDRMLAVVNPSMSEKEREAALNQEIAKIQKENDEGGKYVVSVRSFFQGNEFYYFVYQDFKDVRLVGTPPENVGKFGGDTDNWEWPRHTGDFSVFRVYTDKDGNPAEYSPNNIPMKSQKYLNVSLKGVQEKDFAMILGYPGRTNRWVPSYWVDQQVKYGYPAWVEASKTAMDAMKKHMDADNGVRLKYASAYASLANYWKNRQGMIDALTAHKTAELKRKAEKKFAKWAAKEANKAEYGSVLEDLSSYFAKTNQQAANQNYLLIFFRASQIASQVNPLVKQLSSYLASSSDAEKAQIKERITQGLYNYYNQTYLPAEIDLFADNLKLYADKSTDIPEELNKIKSQYNGDFRRYAADVFAGSIFTTKENLDRFFQNPSQEALDNDPLARIGKVLVDKYYSSENEQLKDTYQKAFRKYVKGMRDSKVSLILYPDANSTLRLTYGSVKSLPKDKRNYDAKKNYYTTFKTMLDKYKPGDAEFDMPAKFMEMYQKGDFGRYLDKDGTMHVNFLTNNDITGGNSGSPVLNGKGELIGLAFDGNIEAMAGDVIFDKKLQRTIVVDIRYVLWCIDTYAGAKHVVDEMTIMQ
ncbi:S46 family peptidase [uncultured Capnocytophaga sp.]|uniref:S46 family peptidase n=1 Tax=uncultured Capnocytophaga sp. TaxID=159273 RepID=UPI00262933FC|nr:S46 family peptidase [uncultured Capnocytophaga sp.]